MARLPRRPAIAGALHTRLARGDCHRPPGWHPRPGRSAQRAARRELVNGSGVRSFSLVLEHAAEQTHQLLVARAALAQEFGDVDLVDGRGVARATHVAAHLLVLDEQTGSVSVEHQAPALL